jgi:hypothetical protein
LSSIDWTWSAKRKHSCANFRKSTGCMRAPRPLCRIAVIYRGGNSLPIDLYFFVRSAVGVRAVGRAIGNRPPPAASELHVMDTGSSRGLRANFALMESHGHVSARHRGRLLAGPMTGSRGPPSNPRRCCGVLGRPVKASTNAQPGDDT